MTSCFGHCYVLVVDYKDKSSGRCPLGYYGTYKVMVGLQYPGAGSSVGGTAPFLSPLRALLGGASSPWYVDG